MQYSNIKLSKTDRVATMRLNRPDALNALSPELISELSHATREVSGDADLKALVVRGEGRGFCAGADLLYFDKVLDDLALLPDYVHNLNAALFALEELPIPTIAVVHGYALAGGMELMMACDMAIVADDARIGDQHANFGLIPGGGSTQRLPRRVGMPRAMELLTTGRWLSGAEAVAGEAGPAALAIETDVADSQSVRALIARTVEHFGRLDVLVNNAGYGITGSVVETDEVAWDRLMAVNLTGVFYGCKHAIPVMQRQGGGVIVNTASTTAIVGIRDRAAYCASKGGVAALTKAMALDHVADGIRVNCIAPGTVGSPYFQAMLAKSDDPEALHRSLAQRQAMGRLGAPEEIASGMLFLACDDSSFATGSMLTVDGGMTAQ